MADPGRYVRLGGKIVSAHEFDPDDGHSLEIVRSDKLVNVSWRNCVLISLVMASNNEKISVR